MKLPVFVLLAATLASPSLTQAQSAQLRLPDLSHLSRKATDSVDVDVGGNMLNLLQRLMQDESQAHTKRLLSKIENISVRSFEFDRDDAYSRSDIDSVFSQLSGPHWSPIIQSHSRASREDTDIYVCIEGDRATGIAIIASEPRGLTIVNIVGSIAIDEVAQLQGQFGIPKL